MKNFLDIKDISNNDLNAILDIALNIKKHPENYTNILKNKKVILLLEKHSTRTRISFEFAVKELGGHIVVLNASNTQLSRGESIEDTARVFNQMTDCIVIRTFGHDRMLKLVENCSHSCVINALTDQSHPCQIMADIMTFMETNSESISGKTVGWYGDVNNMLNSWIEASEILNFNINICCPEELISKIPNNKTCKFFNNKIDCAKNCDIITTDTWVSMGEDKSKSKIFLDGDFKVDMNVMKNAKENAIFLHCLPAYRGYEVDSEVIDDEKYSKIVFQEAGNRLHIQKAILLYCFDKIKYEI